LLAGDPLWSWLGGVRGAMMVLSAIIPAPRLGAAAFVSAMVVGTVVASVAIDHFGLVGFREHPVTTLRLLGGVLVIVGMVLVQTN
jgi:transporter family-2 protein